MYCKNFPEKKFVDVLLTLASNFSSCFHRITAKISTAVFSLAFSKVALR